MYSYQFGGGSCSICKSPGTTKATCPCNPSATKPDKKKHYRWIEVCPEIEVVTETPKAPKPKKISPIKPKLILKPKVSPPEPKKIPSKPKLILKPKVIPPKVKKKVSPPKVKEVSPPKVKEVSPLRSKVRDETIKKLFTPDLPLKLEYSPIPELKTFNFRSVKDWISMPEVRLNLFDVVHLNLSLFPFSSLYNSLHKIRFNSPYREDAQKYIATEVLPRYIATEKDSLVNDTIESDLTKQLIRAFFGFLSVTTTDIYKIFSNIFPGLAIRKVPDDGDCYYTAVGLPYNNRSIEVRERLATEFNKKSPDEQEIIVDSTMGICAPNTIFGKQYANNPAKFIKDFADTLKISCGKGKSDCNGCLWGGNHLDELLLSAYNVPVVSLGITTEMEDDHVVIINKMDPGIKKNFIKIFEQIMEDSWDSNNMILQIPVYQPTLSISIEPILSGLAEKKLMNSKEFIAYIAIAGKHVDAVL